MAPGKKERRSEKQQRQDRREDNKSGPLPASFPYLGRSELTMPPADLDRFGIIKLSLHCKRGLIALVRFSLHRVKDDLLQFFGDLRIHFARRNRVARNP